TLPLVSMGGTSIVFTCISFGMILSVSRYIEKTS
ncbi:MAG: cell division protein FtsW, partial [Gammaproteobacteria bacterium]